MEDFIIDVRFDIEVFRDKYGYENDFWDWLRHNKKLFQHESHELELSIIDNCFAEYIEEIRRENARNSS